MRVSGHPRHKESISGYQLPRDQLHCEMDLEEVHHNTTSFCKRGRPRRSRRTRPVLTIAARSSGPRPASWKRPCRPDRRRPPSANRSRVDASRGPRSSPALRPRWTYRGPCSILQRISTHYYQWSPSRPRTRGPALDTCRGDGVIDGRRNQYGEERLRGALLRIGRRLDDGRDEAPQEARNFQ